MVSFMKLYHCSLFQIALTTLENTSHAKLHKHFLKDGQVSFLQIKDAISLESSLTAEEVLNLENSLKEMFLHQINERKKVKYYF